MALPSDKPPDSYDNRFERVHLPTDNRLQRSHYVTGYNHSVYSLVWRRTMPAAPRDMDLDAVGSRHEWTGLNSHLAKGHLRP